MTDTAAVLQRVEFMEQEARENDDGAILILCGWLRTALADTRRVNEALEKCRRKHDTCEDCWYSCPKSGDCCDDSQSKDFCNCGADTINAIIDTAMAATPRED